jgi:hypothetical protein
MAIELTTTVKRNTQLMTAPVDEEMVILNMARNNYVALDEIGRRIWDLLANEVRVEDLCQQLSREFAATPEEITTDVVPFLNDLVIEGLVHVVVERPA